MFVKRCRFSVAGFTLVEVMVAIVVLGVLIAGSSAFVALGYNSINASKERSFALDLAESTLEHMLAVKPSRAFVVANFTLNQPVNVAFNGINAPQPWRIAAGQAMHSVSDGIGYAVYATATYRNDSGSYLDVNVRVVWSGGQNADMGLSNQGLSTRISLK